MAFGCRFCVWGEAAALITLDVYIQDVAALVIRVVGELDRAMVMLIVCCGGL